MTAVRALPLLVLLAACAAPLGQPGLLDFLSDNKTTRDDVLLHLGTPTASYESGRVFIYQLGQDEGYFLLDDPRNRQRNPANFTRDDLTLVFSQAGVLQRHALAPRQ